MTKRMLVDATHIEETRVAIVDSYRDINRLDDLDIGLASKPIIRGNIYLAKVMRIEPSLQAAFVEYGGNRHGFLPFSEIHPDYFRIPMADRPQDEEDEPEELTSAEIAETESQFIETEVPEPDEHEDHFAQRDEAQLDEVRVEAAPVSVPESFASSYERSEPAEAPASMSMGSFQSSEDMDVGLITDFGNAAVPPLSMDGETPAPPIPPVESLGGEVTERFVRQQRRQYKIQEVLKRGQIMLIQVVKEERGNKGAALTSFLSLAGRYCVLMPNTDHGGGVSRKITNHQDRRRMKETLDQLEIPEGMAVILRTAGMEQDPPEIQRDLEYLMRLWDSIREQTLQSTAPSLIYEEANLIKRAVRDLYSQDIQEILVAGADGHEKARDFMRTIMPDQVEKIKLYDDPIPLFFRYGVESQIDNLFSPTVQLRSGGYLVINPTEALVSIDVNSGRATRERHIEETAVKTNLEAADEVARQLRLRDLAGLVVIDFIDMENTRNITAVERRLKEAMKNDRARLQIGHISAFGLMELSRQRMRPSLLEINFEKCPHCTGMGFVRSVDSAAFSILRAIEEEGIRQRSGELILHVPTKIALYILNQKRAMLSAIEHRYDLHVLLHSDDTLVPPDYRLERARGTGTRLVGPAVNADQVFSDVTRDLPPMPASGDGDSTADNDNSEASNGNARNGQPSGNPRRRFRQGQNSSAPPNRRERNPRPTPQQYNPAPEGHIPAVASQDANQDDVDNEGNSIAAAPGSQAAIDAENQQRRRRRGRRGGRRRNGEQGERPEGAQPNNNRWGRPHNPNLVAPPMSAAAMNGHVPMSIHDIDTTPRAPSPPRQAAGHENTNPPSESPKGGWWKRLTGQ